MKIDLKFIVLLFLFLFLQLLWFNQFKLFGRFIPIIYIYPFLILSFSQNNLQLILAFISGLILDIFLHTGGVFAAVTVFIIYFRKLLITPFLTIRRSDDDINPTQLSFNSKLFYFGITIFLTIVFFNLLESLSFTYVIYKIPLFIINTFLSLLIVIFIDYLFISRTN